MDFTKEPHVRIFTTVSPTARTWGFFGRMLMDALIKAADRAGVVDLAPELVGDLPRAVASAIHCEDIEWVRTHLPRLMEGPVPAVELRKEVYLVLPRYHEGQYSNIDPLFSTAASRRKFRDTERAIHLGIIEMPFWMKPDKENVA